MTIELRKSGDLEQPPDRVPVRQRVREQWVRGRIVATAVARRRGWSVWRSTRRAATIAWRIVWQLPGVAVLLVAYSPRGAVRLVRSWVSFVRDDATVELRAHHAGAKETGDYAKASAVRSANLRARILPQLAGAGLGVAAVLAWTAPQALAIVLAVVTFYVWVRVSKKNTWEELAVGVGVAYGVYLLAPWAASYLPRPPEWVWWLLGAVGVAAAGWAGRPRAKPLVTLPGVEDVRVPPLTAPMVTAALIALGNGKMSDPDAVRLLSDPHRNGPGVQVDLELPPAVTASWVMAKREDLAAALRREIGTVWPSRGVRHPGHLSLFVSDQAMSQASQAPWPLRNGGEVDLFDPQKLFTDQRGHWVDVTLAYASVVIGAVPRMGKTFIERELLVVAGFDPRAKVAALDGKGTGDFAPLRPFLDFYSVGDEPEELDRVVSYLRKLRVEMRRRAGVIRGLPFERCPGNKVTSELASDRALGLEPIVLGIDETQIYFEDAPKETREECASIVTDLVKRGPALGIIVILATQSVTKDTVPTGISNNAVIRICLKMEGHQQNDRVLGTGAYKRGIDAQMFDINDKGIAYLKAEGADPRIVRSVFGLDAVDTGRLAELARDVRAAVGRLTGEAAAEVPAPVLDAVLDCIRELVAHGRDAAHLAELVEWLAASQVGYATLSVDELGRRLRDRGVETVQVKRVGQNRMGVRLADLRKQSLPAGADLPYLEGD